MSCFRNHNEPLPVRRYSCRSTGSRQCGECNIYDQSARIDDQHRLAVILILRRPLETVCGDLFHVHRRRVGRRILRIKVVQVVQVVVITCQCRQPELRSVFHAADGAIVDIRQGGYSGVFLIDIQQENIGMHLKGVIAKPAAPPGCAGYDNGIVRCRRGEGVVLVVGGAPIVCAFAFYPSTVYILFMVGYFSMSGV